VFNILLTCRSVLSSRTFCKDSNIYIYIFSFEISFIKASVTPNKTSTFNAQPDEFRQVDHLCKLTKTPFPPRHQDFEAARLKG
jgi:hypothetical protein